MRIRLALLTAALLAAISLIGTSGSDTSQSNTDTTVLTNPETLPAPGSFQASETGQKPPDGALLLGDNCDAACAGSTVLNWLDRSDLNPADRIRNALTTIDSMRGAEALGMCHSLAHSVGIAAVQRFGTDVAVSAFQPSCEEGFAHGVAEAAGKMPDFDVTSFSTLLCQALDENTCAHSVGHAVGVATDGNLVKADSDCRAFARTITERAFDHDQGSVTFGCQVGAMMFSFEAANEGRGELANIPIEQRCAQLPAAFLAACERELGAQAVIAGKGAAAAFSICAAVEETQRQPCAAQAGDHLIWTDKNLAGFVAACRDVTSMLALACIVGGARAVDARPGWITGTAVCNAWDDPVRCQAVLDDWKATGYLHVDAE